ncbi:unnamed protein product [Rotaria socialis]|uniref:ADP ribosyltransferase domain-containing protein n=1 Tax=Rotaria socialis TaxID=392032 RepID=A0A818A9S8_9BILA|nr:unnamed protein product [Rotaria socialis]CAF4812175.1 unnamed protein product [Rotaria socialis]
MDQFKQEYRPETSSWWYTKESFIFESLNYSLRSLDTKVMMTMGLFIGNLYRQIVKLHQQQYHNCNDVPFLVYCGQGLSIVDFDKIRRNKGGLITFNNFLSTSKQRDIAFLFAESSSIMHGIIGIIFEICINPNMQAAAFANIAEISNFGNEEEILFSMNTAFRVGSINQAENREKIWEVRLILTDDNDPQLINLTKKMREETGGPNGWFRMA